MSFTAEELELIRAGKAQYSLLQIPVSSAQTNKQIAAAGKKIIAVQVPVDAWIRINSVSADPIDLRVVREIEAPFKVLYLTNTETSSSTLDLLISSGAGFSAFQSSARVTLLTPGGADYDARTTSQTLLSSTTANLNAGAEYTTPSWISVSSYRYILALWFADQNLTVRIQFSGDGTNLDTYDEYTYTASSYTNNAAQIPVVAPRCRLYLKNTGSAATTVLRAYMWGQY
ncbi:hypothetical protein [Huginn virus]|nr:hypothetical protein [Huginn virus]